MQADTISRLQNMSSIVKTHSPLSGIQAQQQHQPHHQQQHQHKRPSSNNSGQLDNIFNSVKRQIDQWGENAKWKIDLVLLENPQQQQQQQSSNNSLHPLLSPQHLHPNVITTPSNNNNSSSSSSNKHGGIDNVHSGDSIGPSTTLSLPVTSTIQYPWDYVAPTNNDWRQNSDDLQQKLREMLERQKYLESVIWSQAEQIKHTSIIPDKDNAINTMKSIFLMSQNEQRMHYILESNLLHKDIETLSKKLQKMASILTDIENMELPTEDTQLDKETLLSDRKILLRKLHLAELRLSARDAEIDYLHEVVESLKSNSLQQPSSPYMNNVSITSPKPSSQAFGKKLRKGPPYLFQQQYSPRSSEVRSSEQHPLSGLDSLGIVADQMLSDPEFETSTISSRTNEKRLRTRLDDRRSQRSIDSAATLLAMPQLMVPQRTSAKAERFQEQSASLSPEQQKQQPFEHNIPKKPRSTYTRWTEAEDALLRKAVKKYGHSNWEACSKDVHGRSNIQCRNRWIRHLEHRIVEEPKEEEEYDHPAEFSSAAPKRQYHTDLSQQQTSPSSSNARQSPSIAALLNDDRVYNSYSPRSTPKQLYDHSEALTKEPTSAAGPSTSASASASASSSYYHHHPPAYRPPSPMATPKGGKRRSPEDVSPPPHQHSNKW